MLGIVGPDDAAEIGHPARNGDVAQVAPAVDEGRVRKEHRQKSEIHVIIGHLVGDSLGSPRAPGLSSGRDAGRPAVRIDVGIQARDAFEGRRVQTEHAGNRLERLAAQPQLAGPVDLGMAGQHLLDQSRSRPRQAEDEDRQPRLASPGRPVRLNNSELNVLIMPSTKSLVVGRHVVAAVLFLLEGQRVGLA